MNETKLKIVEFKGDLFDAPANTLLVHACNCQGSWSAGIAKEFSEKYPHAFLDYSYKCDSIGKYLHGKAHIVLPINILEHRNTYIELSTDELAEENLKKHFVGCLFTSRYYGKLRGSTSDILKATLSSIIDLLQQVTNWNESADNYIKINEIRMCKINAGLFGVPWSETKAILESVSVTQSYIKVIKVAVV